MAGEKAVTKRAGVTKLMQRICYLCGRETPRRLIVGPHLTPTCSERECRERAEQLPARHCFIRLAQGRLCGGPVTMIQLDGNWICSWHARLTYDALTAA